eukprot:8438303-Pyramimonas_sp.AAC.1
MLRASDALLELECLSTRQTHLDIIAGIGMALVSELGASNTIALRIGRAATVFGPGGEAIQFQGNS